MRSILAIVVFVLTLGILATSVEGQVYIPHIGTGPATDTPIPTDIPTSTPTFTPTPTNTTEPTVTPTATNTPLPTPVPGMNVLDNHSTYVNSIDYLNIVGEVQNNTGENTWSVKVTANLFNAQDQLVDTSYTYINPNILTPGQTSCFRVVFRNSTNWSYYQFETDYSDASQVPLPITTYGDSGSQDSTFDNWYNIIGQARNDSNVTAEYVQVVGTIYYSDGRVLGCDYTYTNADTLTPGQSSTWKITFLYAPEGSVSSYRIHAQGREE